MNFLAHVFLSGDDQEVMLGNFIGDFVKGNRVHAYGEKIKQGIILHRAIDFYTDRHPLVRQSKSRLSENYGHYSAVVVDIFYDHFLASDFQVYHGEPLKDFSEKTYQVLEENREMMPERAAYMLNYMIPQNWLLNYASIEGISRTLNGISRRTRFDSGIEHAVTDLERHYELFFEEFRSFFPDVQQFAAEELKKLK